MKFLFVITLLLPSLTHKEARQYFVVWNVGQGLWTTLTAHKTCYHFDVGGEKRPPIEKLQSFCATKEQRISISHWDSDHRNFLGWLKWNLSKACFITPSTWGREYRSEKVKKKQLSPACKESLTEDPFIFSPPHHLASQKNTNELSYVIWHRSLGLLIPGDSPKKMERVWAEKIEQPPRVWLLGHHGSLTSSGSALLERMGTSTHAVASARKRRYGHPHEKIVNQLKRRRVPLLRTEDWGHLIFEIRSYRVGTPFPNHEPLAHNKQNRRRH